MAEETRPSDALTAAAQPQLPQAAQQPQQSEPPPLEMPSDAELLAMPSDAELLAEPNPNDVANAAPPLEMPTAADLQAPEQPDQGGWTANRVLSDLTTIPRALGVGAARALFEAKDFLAGHETPESDRSQLRQYFDKAGSGEGAVFGLTEGIGQFSTGMLGLGALGVEGGMAKAAIVGATMFDPHDANLANIVQSVPALQNPVTQFLSNKEGDPEALDRAKNAMLSIGVDVAASTLFAKSLALYRAIKGGDNAEAVAAAHADVQQAHEDHAAAQTAPETPTPANDNPAPALAGEAQPPASESPSATAQPSAPVKSDTGVPSDATVSADVRMVDNATQAQSLAGGPAKSAVSAISDEAVSSIIKSARDDSAALMEHGTWENAVDAGHVFGDPDHSIPWQKITDGGKPASGIDAYIARVAETLQADMDAAKGGAVIGDAKNDAMVAQRVNLWNEDPATLLGMLQTAGKDSIQLRANMDASFLVAQRVMQDAYSLAARINAGYLDEFGGSRDAAMLAFKQMNEVAATAYAQANAMRANAGRALRGMRSDFEVTPGQVELMRNADPEVMLQIMGNTEGNPKALVKALQPGLWEPGGLAYAAKQWGEAAQFFLINNLVSNPLTHAVIASTNAYQVASRPMERLIGSWVQRAAGLKAGAAGNAEAANIGASALKQYTYMASVLHDSFQEAVKAFNAGDAIMAPHATEVSPNGAGALGQTIAQMPFKPFDSVSNIMSNFWIAAMKTQGLPTRFVGAQDELVKQIVYRSKVLADAHVEGIQAGLDGADLTQHVQGRLMDAFDSAGRATNLTLLNEAKVATYQQDLKVPTNFGTKSFGESVNEWRNGFPALKVILPFVPTPVNLFRNGVKLTPGLNLLQAEYRQMIQGTMGAEQQAQAMGQMAMGSLFFGTAATLAYEGRITGAGPSDEKARQALLNTGWRPYSFVLPQSDGSIKYVPFGRFDPVAMPFGMMADIMDVATHPDPIIAAKARPMAEAMATGMLKSLTDKLYLQNLAHTIEAIDNPDANFWKVGGSLLAEYVPMSSALKAANPDPYLREARTFLDRAKMNIPGFSESIPAKYDMWGDPVSVHKGLWLTDKGSYVDHEMNRMATEQGVTLGAPPPTARGGVDLRGFQMSDGSDAYEKLQQLSAQPAQGVPRLKDYVADFMHSDTYRNVLVDGDAQTRGTRLNAILDIMGKYRSAAERTVLADPLVSKAAYAKQMQAQAAMAQKQANPTPANQTSDMLGRLGQAFGVDLHAMTGAAGAQAPSPLAPGSKVVH